MMSVWYGIFVVFKYIFGLGALLALLGIGAMLLWFALHLIVRFSLRNQPADCCLWLRQLFLETPYRAPS
ncbi:hypothetical protein [Candidatus Entotheonella palauensis]|uniref:Uncharacterized protein n=1 Tax=Candidatus Entotheonella gemina TaxID=1429439 RepID=W4M644_9BACT|nr:hypothetical protein [Candidatus Entotheonella palauensis]ETX05391.1 MAG: hypothetical protein ETSY2_23215 [Candidatus Entotheonella gemina]